MRDELQAGHFLGFLFDSHLTAVIAPFCHIFFAIIVRNNSNSLFNFHSHFITIVRSKLSYLSDIH